MRRDRRFGIGAGALVVTGVFVLQGCGGHRLAEYDFVDQSLAVVYFAQPAPELWTGGVDVEGDNPLEMVMSAGGRVAREVEGRRAQARLDSAASRLDLSGRMADRTLQRASRYLGTRPVEQESEADYLLEVDVRRMGLNVGGSSAYLVVVAEVILLDGRTGREIWDADVNGRDRLTPGVHGGSDLLGDVVTVGALSSVSVDEFEAILEGLTDFVADRVARELRSDLRDARD